MILFITGIITVFFFLSNLVVVINELFVKWRNIRGRFLKRALSKVLDDKENAIKVSELLFNDAVVRLSGSMTGKYPAFIYPEDFSRALIDVITSEEFRKAYLLNPLPDQYSKAEQFRYTVYALEDGDLKGLLTSFLKNSVISEFDLISEKQLQVQIQGWFNRYMENVTLWFKEASRIRLFLISVGVTVFLNLDAFKMVSYFWNENVIQKNATDLIKNASLLSDNSAFMDNEPVSNLSMLPFGWSIPDSIHLGSCSDLYLNFRLNAITISGKTILGWFITAFSIMLGSPFWFDMLNKYVTISGPPKNSGSRKKKRN